MKFVDEVLKKNTSKNKYIGENWKRAYILQNYTLIRFEPPPPKGISPLSGHCE